MLDTKDAYSIAAGIAKESGLQPQLYDDKTVEGLSRYENFQELLNSIKAFVEADEVDTLGTMVPDKQLGTYLQQVSLLTDSDDNKKKDEAVKLMTVHAAKGLEFPIVYIVGLEEELFPSRMSLGERDGIEEERRLFYVASTRAEKKLNLSYSKCRIKFGKLIYPERSRFLDELNPFDLEIIGEAKKKTAPRKTTAPSNLFSQRNRKKPTAPRPVIADPNFKPDDTSKLEIGQQVKHQRFGVGTVNEMEGNHPNKIATISFEDVGDKRILLKFAKLQIIA